MLVRGSLYDTPAAPGLPALRVETDGGLLVRDGIILARGSGAALAAAHPDEEVLDLRGGLVLPGFVDTHVHFPQVRIIGGLGMPLLDWLDHRALPEEVALRDAAYAAGVADDFLAGLTAAGTTTALVFGSHHPVAMRAFLAAAAPSGLRLTAGLVVSDVELPEPLLTTPERAVADGLALAAETSAAGGHLRYAITPRFAYSCSPALLEACGELAAQLPEALVTSHVNESPAEIVGVAERHPEASDYVGVYERHGLLGARTVLAHDVHPTPRELAVLAATGTAIAHCPTSNAALGSGLFPLRAHRDAGVRVALGSDVGAGTGFSLLKEALQAALLQRLLPDGVDLTPTALLHLATAAGAAALGLSDVCGEFSEGHAFDAVWVRPPEGGVLDAGLRHAVDDEDALGRVLTLGGPADVAGVWVGGRRLLDRTPA